MRSSRQSAAETFLATLGAGSFATCKGPATFAVRPIARADVIFQTDPRGGSGDRGVRPIARDAARLARGGVVGHAQAGRKTKSRARPASPRSRPTSPVNGAGGITGCLDDSDAPESF